MGLRSPLGPRRRLARSASTPSSWRAAGDAARHGPLRARALRGPGAHRARSLRLPAPRPARAGSRSASALVQQKLRTRIGVVFPATTKGTRLELWDRATDRRWSLPWPPASARATPAATDASAGPDGRAVRLFRARPGVQPRQRNAGACRARPKLCDDSDRAMQCPSCQTPVDDSQRFCPAAERCSPRARRRDPTR